MSHPSPSLSLPTLLRIWYTEILIYTAINPTMPSRPSFPPEIWSITLGNLRERQSQEELTYLWTTARHVCRQFKEEIEEIFRTEHLPKTWLYIDNRESWHTYSSCPSALSKGYPIPLGGKPFVGLAVSVRDDSTPSLGTPIPERQEFVEFLSPGYY